MIPRDADTSRCPPWVGAVVRSPGALSAMPVRTIRNRSSEGESGGWRRNDILRHHSELAHRVRSGTVAPSGGSAQERSPMANHLSHFAVSADDTQRARKF